jgi:endonuclease G
MDRRRKSNGFDPRDVERATKEFIALDRRLQILVIAIILIVGSIVAIVHFTKQHRQQASQSPSTTAPQPDATLSKSREPSSQVLPTSVDLLLGNPSSATSDSANRVNYLMLKPYYALSYNEPKGIPNWVSWRLTKLDLGPAPRKQLFDPDITLPKNFYHVIHGDYSGSGFDRGHMCPHADRAASEEMSFATFIMTNIIPQAPNVNQKAWANLEDYCRSLVRRDRNRLYIISGPAGQGGIGSAGSKTTLAGGKVTVPAECWKIVVIVPEAKSEDDLAKITINTRVISVRMPNDNDAVSNEWAKYRTTAADIEQRTGYRFFDRVAPEIAEKLRAKLDTARISTSNTTNFN